jgi:prepilin-type N-terminal cleavage/methylation domain-containing protein
MTTSKGWTLIELMIFIVIIGIVAAIVLPVFNRNTAESTTSTSWGAMGAVETRCIGGYKYTVDRNGARQMLSEFGKGVPCDTPASKPER